MATTSSIRQRKTETPRKASRTFRLTEGKVEAAQKILGTSTATEAIETALDMVVFRNELIRGTKAAFGIQFRESPRRRR
jgi:hypothetical protein